MKKFSVIAILLLGAAAVAVIWADHKAAAHPTVANQPVYTSDGKLVLPANYRDWTFLTSGLGMNYSTGANSEPMFTNVYVTPEALQGFKATGKWPDKSMFIVELYSSVTHGSINKGGHYQDSFHGLDVEVKDSSRPDEWSYYNFGPRETTGELFGAGCNNCHSKNAAVENTFVQFYPTLLDFSIEKNLIKPGVNIPLNQSRFIKLIENGGWEKAEQAYYQDRKQNPDSDLLNEHALNQLGYWLLSHKNLDRAIAVLELTTKNYPDSVNAYDSLGEAYAAAGQRQLAIAASQKEMALAQKSGSLSTDRKKQFIDLAQSRIAQMNK